MKIRLALIVVWTAAVPVFAQTDSDSTQTTHGFAASDGDTGKFGKQLIRLIGIGAPERLQPCDDGKWFPGPLATKALVAFIAGRPVSCHLCVPKIRFDVDSGNTRRKLVA